MNKVVLIGRLTKKPEVEYTQNRQTALCRFTLAVDRMGKDKGADFIRVTSFGKDAENLARYMDKGRQVGVEGKIQTGSYTKDGQTVYTTDVIADRVEFLGNKTEQKPQETDWNNYDIF